MRARRTVAILVFLVVGAHFVGLTQAGGVAQIIEAKAPRRGNPQDAHKRGHAKNSKVSRKFFHDFLFKRRLLGVGYLNIDCSQTDILLSARMAWYSQRH